MRRGDHTAKGARRIQHCPYPSSGVDAPAMDAMIYVSEYFTFCKPQNARFSPGIPK
ncbi:hypothetical protein CSIRO_2273 [Bradyrhizobiaceae bacterium SG-6C]|nr:hypothetical protein CSIRO_2273 [Bradyrhizobiaceae bacterium SG-6C]